MSEMNDKLGQMKLIPVVVIEDAADALPLGQALIDGGLPCAEVTFRTAAAPDATVRPPFLQLLPPFLRRLRGRVAVFGQPHRPPQ